MLLVQAYVTSSDLARKVAAWHEMIAPRLELVEQRSEFDIHAYGTRILDTFGRERGAVRSFGLLMAGKPKEEVLSCIFLTKGTSALVNCFLFGTACFFRCREIRSLLTGGKNLRGK